MNDNTKDNKEGSDFDDRDKDNKIDPDKNPSNSDEEENSTLDDKLEFDLERIFFNRKKMNFRQLLKNLFK